MAEMERVIEVVPPIIAQLRKLSRLTGAPTAPLRTRGSLAPVYA